MSLLKNLFSHLNPSDQIGKPLLEETLLEEIRQKIPSIPKIKDLIKKCNDLNIKTKTGWTLLMLAAHYGHTEIAQELLNAGANPDAQSNEEGWTALMQTAHNGHTDIAKLLMKAGANPDVQNSDGWTAFMIAAHCGHISVAELSKEYPENPCLQNKNGDTTVSILLDTRKSEYVKLALEIRPDLHDLWEKKPPTSHERNEVVKLAQKPDILIPNSIRMM
jgi:ankyrin repeat protein